MTPAVSALGSVLFWDPFAATGIYDPVVYTNSKRIPIPGWSPESNDRFVLKKWIRPEGTKVNKGDPIATISRDNGSDITVMADARGTLNHLVAEGNVRRLIIRKPDGETLLEIPLTAGVAVGGAVTIVAPVLAALGALAALLAEFKLEVIRTDDLDNE